MDHHWTEYGTSAHHDAHHREVERLKQQLAEQDARGLRLAEENERLLDALTDIVWVQGFTTYDEARDCARQAIRAYREREVIAEANSPR